MRTSVSLLCATLLLAAIISTVSGRPKKCEPGETHMEDCNTCKCNNDGTSFACTRRGCPPKPEGGQQLERHTRATTKQVCVPDSSFLDEQKCNTCKCNKEGTAAACTLKLCL